MGLKIKGSSSSKVRLSFPMRVIGSTEDRSMDEALLGPGDVRIGSSSSSPSPSTRRDWRKSLRGSFFSLDRSSSSAYLAGKSDDSTLSRSAGPLGAHSTVGRAYEKRFRRMSRALSLSLPRGWFVRETDTGNAEPCSSPSLDEGDDSPSPRPS